uniref:SCAN box domain-containing protein n=1 Tax=Astyanax mexicanus TaxID=7994 RepID=A0A3B1JPB5_ASTMX
MGQYPGPFSDRLKSCNRHHLGPAAASAEFHRWKVTRRWLQPDHLSAEVVAERVTMDHFLHTLPGELQKAVGLKDPSTATEVADFILSVCLGVDVIRGICTRFALHLCGINVAFGPAQYRYRRSADRDERRSAIGIGPKNTDRSISSKHHLLLSLLNDLPMPLLVGCDFPCFDRELQQATTRPRDLSLRPRQKEPRERALLVPAISESEEAGSEGENAAYSNPLSSAMSTLPNHYTKETSSGPFNSSTYYWCPI